MIEISFGKLVVLALIALIVLGPQKLPGAARTAGALLRRMRAGWDNVRAEVERELQIEEIKRNAREVAASAEAAQAELGDAVSKVREMGSQVAAQADAAKAQLEAPVAGESAALASPLGDAEEAVTEPTPAADASDADNHTGDLFGNIPAPSAPTPPSPESPNGRV